MEDISVNRTQCNLQSNGWLLQARSLIIYIPCPCEYFFQSYRLLESYYCSSSACDKLVWTRNELSELVMYLQCMPLELELELTLVNPWQSTNLNTWVQWLNTRVEWLNTQVSIECMRKIGTHLRFGAHEHEVRNELYHSYLNFNSLLFYCYSRVCYIHNYVVPVE